MLILIRASAVVVDDKKILLCRRSKDKTHYPDAWTIPGGQLEKLGETCSEYLARRVKQQLGLEFEAEKKLWFYETHHEKGACVRPCLHR
jgi:ADP-ribose pyrophosphatase YjhB (NUDIX family)